LSIATPFSVTSNDKRLLGQIRSTGIYLNENVTVGTMQQVDLSIRDPIAMAIHIGNKLIINGHQQFALSLPTILGGNRGSIRFAANCSGLGSKECNHAWFSAGAGEPKSVDFLQSA